MTTVSSSLPSQFSQQTLDLQKDFCCNGKDSRKLVRWVTNSPGVYLGNKTLFSASDLSLSNWYQEVIDYQYVTILLDPGEVNEVVIDAKYIFAKAVWATDALESLKNIEIGINEQQGVVGMTIPFFIGVPEPPIYDYHLFNDLFSINTSSKIGSKIRFNNVSPYIVAISMLHAK